MMKRITFGGMFCDIADCFLVPGDLCCENGTCSQRQVWERLKAIENILGDEYDLDHLRDLLQAEKDGIIPPCKRGDVVYCIRRNPRTGYYVKALTVCTVTVWGPGRFSVFTTKEDVLGKTVFLTRAEAEAALTDTNVGNMEGGKGHA